MPTEKDLQFLGQLIALDTTTQAADYTGITTLIRAECEKLGAEVTMISPPINLIPDGKPRPNIIARFSAPGAMRTLALNAHFDVLPAEREKDGWMTEPFELTLKEGKAFGRGSNDDKGGIAAILGAVRDSQEAKKTRTNLELFFTCDEEIGSKWGADYVLSSERQKIKSEGAIVIDGGENISVGASGGIFGIITFTGKSWHAGWPFLAVNPIATALPFLQEISGFEDVIKNDTSRFPGLYYDGETTKSIERPVSGRFCFTIIQAGDAGNKIPANLEATFNLRVGPEISIEDTVSRFQNYFDRVKEKYSGGKVKIAFREIGRKKNSRTKLDSWVVQRAKELLGTSALYDDFGGNDSSAFNENNIPAISYGLFNESAHQPNEYLSLTAFDNVKAFLRTFIENPG